MHGLAEYVREAVKAVDPDAITSGEDSSENMIDVIDGKLYQYTLTPNSRAPLFAAVYQDYIPRYGMVVKADGGNESFMEAGSLFVEGAQMGRLHLEPMRDSLSFEQPERKEMVDFLGRLVAYYRQEGAKKFLCYGQLMRPLAFREPSPLPLVTYEAEKRTVGQPALLCGVFRSQDGEVGVFIVNISAGEMSFASDVELASYGLAPGAAVDVESISPEGAAKAYAQGVTRKIALRGRLPARDVMMFFIKP
jgi:hypothetical protein